MATNDQVPDPPGHLKDLADRLLSQRFVEVQSEYDAESFGNVVRVFERKPVRVRIVRDRGVWSAELTADPWLQRDHFHEEWVFLPPLIAEPA